MKCPKCGRTDISTDEAWEAHECVGKDGCHHRWSTKKECHCPKCGSKRTIWDVAKKPWTRSYENRVMRCCDCDKTFWESEAMKVEPEVKCPKCGRNIIRVRGEDENTIVYECMHSLCKYIFNRKKTVDVPIDISDETFNTLAKMAHEQDITFNELVCRILREEMEKEEKSLVSYKINIRKYYDEHKDEICRDYTNWLERKLYDNDVPVKP
jgi:DNA-directed RNA polymerase subunit RPC12/RpoP